MNSSQKVRNYTISISISIVIVYMLFNTGLHGDDYVEIIKLRDSGFLEFIDPSPDKRGVYSLGLPNYYLLHWAFPIFGFEYQFGYDLIKIIVHLLCVYLVYRFARDYLRYDRAIIASLIFIFFPFHDATTYWYMTLIYLLTPSILLFSHHLIRNNYHYSGFFFALLGSMSFYASPPFVFGLSIVFFIEREFKKAAIFVIPGLIYVAYYFWIKYSFHDIELRINLDMSIFDFIKQLFIQLVSLIESVIGPSYWIKIYYSIGSISLISALIATVIFYHPKTSDNFLKFLI